MKPSTANIACAGALDIGGTKIACGIVNAGGEILAETAFPTQPERGAAAQIQAAANQLQEMQARLGVPLAGIGIGCTGPVEPLTGTVGPVPFLPGWEGFALTHCLGEQFGLPVFLENDADAALLAETRFGAGQDCETFLLVTLGTGIGGGLWLNRRLYRGAGGAHPEIGHMIIHAHGLACGCGGQGCWETYCGGQGLADWVQAKWPRPAPLSAAQIFDQAARGSRRYADSVRKFSADMGIGLANLITLYAPQRIALTGGLMKSRPVFWEALQLATRQGCHLVPAQTTQLVQGQLGTSAGLVGAASVFFTQQEASR